MYEHRIAELLGISIYSERKAIGLQNTMFESTYQANINVVTKSSKNF